MSSIKISDRLEKVAKCVNKGNRVADIGCDHAYTAIYMIKNNIAKNVIAMDINKGPLHKADNNIKEYGCEKQIETRLSDGAKELQVGEVDTILISGMGGRLTKKILEESLDVIKSSSQLVLQPQSEIYIVRQFLHEIGFKIECEDMLIDDGKYYVIINAINEYTKNKITDISRENNKELFDKYGQYLLENKNKILQSYLLKELNKTNDITTELEIKNNDYNRLTQRINELKREKQLISEALKYYEN